MIDSETFSIWADWHGISEPAKVGSVTLSRRRRDRIAGFSFQDSWLERQDFRMLDPEIQPFRTVPALCGLPSFPPGAIPSTWACGSISFTSSLRKQASLFPLRGSKSSPKSAPPFWSSALIARLRTAGCTFNCDDHLRNHGFLLDSQGWRLSPGYDINPDPTGSGLALDISEADNRLSLDLVRSVASYFGLERNAAEGRLNEILGVVSRWRILARSLGISRADMETMSPAFPAQTR